MTERDSRVAVVTGAAKGIGRAVALALAADGYDVAILDPLERGQTVADEAREAGRGAVYLPVDVSDEASVREAVSHIDQELGTPTILVNNAGIYPRASALEMPFDLWQRVLTVNLGGAFLCSRSFAPGMLRVGGGAIVNIASGRALQGAVGGAHYASSKGGILSLTRSLALEWAPTIRVNTIIPGVTDTDQPREGGVSDEDLYARGSRIPLGRIGQPEDIADAVCYLVSPRARYVTGQALAVNGGAIMH